MKKLKDLVKDLGVKDSIIRRMFGLLKDESLRRGYDLCKVPIEEYKKFKRAYMKDDFEAVLNFIDKYSHSS